MVDQDGRHSDMMLQLLHYVTSSPYDADVKGDIFRPSIYPPSPQAVEDQRKPGLNRVKL